MRGGTCVLAIIALAVNLLHINGYDYCSNETKMKPCPIGSKHFMCNQDEFIPRASFMSQVVMTQSLRRFMLEQFNNHRNKIAGGEEAKDNKTFPKAARMRELMWDWELGYMAKEYANHCAHYYKGTQQCFNTERFPDVVKFLIFSAGPKPRTTKDRVKQALDLIHSYRYYVTDPVNYVKTFHKSKYCFYMTCFLDAGLHTNDLIYTISEGDAASDCSHWNTDKSSDYENLCANSGEIFE